MTIGAFNLNGFIEKLTTSFISLYFLLLVAIIVTLYYLVSMNNRWIVLLLGSILFIAVGGLLILLIPLLTTIIAYCAAIIIENTEKELKRKRRTVIAISVVVFLVVLAFVKLSMMFEWNIRYFIFPVGISFYTFSIISYIADVYWGKDKAEKNYFKLALFVLYFPKILQGPIARHRDIAPQLIEGRKFSYENLCFGIQLMIWGYFKKMIIADRINILTTEVFGNYNQYGGWIIFIALMLAAVQLYCDFSGYMDIASGASQMLGISLAKNFNHPFFSRGAAEFWRRWHITLGLWFKDYVYLPLVISPNMIKISGWFKKHFGKQVGKSIIIIIPLTVVWLLTGLWHGTGLNYLIWGLYWGLLIIISTLLAKKNMRINQILHINTESPSWRVFQMVRTFLLFSFGRLLTIPNDLRITGEIIDKFFKSSNVWELADGTLYTLGLDQVNLSILLCSIAMLWLVSLVQTKHKIRESISNWNVFFRCLLYSASFLVIFVLGIYGPEYTSTVFAYMGY